jgi:hypothetical protein
VTQRQENSLGLTETFYYDNLYRLEHSTLTNGGGTSANLTLVYDNGSPGPGNITAMPRRLLMRFTTRPSIE